MPFIVRNGSDTNPFALQDQYLDIIFAPSEHVDMEEVFAEDSLYMSSVSPNALWTAIQNGDIVRRNDADDADIAAANAFDDAIWRWSPTRQQKEALVGRPVSPSSVNKYLTQGVFSLKATVSGTQRWGDLVLIEGTNISITDDGAGNFTIAAASVFPYAAPVTLVPDSGNIEGTNTSAARSDHKHNIPADTAVSVSTTNAEGTSTSLARADHLHQGIHSLKAKATGTARYGDIVFLEGSYITITDDGAGNFTIAASAPTSFGTPVTLVPDSGNIEGTSTSSARADHKHDLPADTAVSVSTANAEGTSTSIARADHVHQGIHSLKANAGGTARYGDLVLVQGTNITITDDGAGNFTIAGSAFGSPVSLVPDSGNVDGTNTTVARSDHKHDLPADTAVSITTSNAEGTSTSVARADHLHQGIHSLKATAGGTARYGDLVFLAGTNISISDDGSGNFTFTSTTSPTFGSPVTLIPDGGNVDGTNTSVARSDHKHDLPADVPITIPLNLTNAEGTSTSVARADHRHNLPTAIPVSVASTNAEGTNSSVARSDHLHQGIHSLKATAGGTLRYGDLVFLAGTNISISDDGAGNFTFASTTNPTFGSPLTLIPDGGNVDGTNTSVARSDHKHNLPADVPVAIGVSSNVEGTSTSVARADHIHSSIERLKAGTVASGSFSGNPKKASVTFGTAFPSTSYAIKITGIDSRGWTYESKATTGFTINSNANAALTGEVSWEAITSGN